MKKLILLFLFSMNAFATQPTYELLVVKKENYQLMRSYYSDLREQLVNGKTKEFCKIASSVEPILYTIYEEDRQLYISLIQHGNVDFDEYAVHINNNSRSDLFNFSYYEHKCNNNDALSILERFDLTWMNLEFLIMTHDLWMKSYFPSLR